MVRPSSLTWMAVLLGVANCFAGTWMMSPGKGSHGAAAAPFNQWYYSGSGNTDTSFPTSSTGGFSMHTFAYGSTITLPAAGTLTHLAFQGNASSGTVNFKIGLFDGSNNLVVSGGPTLISSSVAWQDFDVTDTAVAAGTYSLNVSAESDNGRFRYLNTQAGIYDDILYAAFPPAALTSPSANPNQLLAARMFVTNKTIASLRSLATTTYASRTNTTISAPAGLADGDVMIMAFVIGAAGTPPTPTLPAGWTVIQGPTTQTSGGFQVTRRLAWKVASGEGTDYTITHTAASSDCVIAAIQNGSSSSIVSTSNGGTGQTITALGVTTTVDQSVILFIGHNWVLYGSAAPPTGTTPVFTERSDSATSLLYVASGILGTAGATGDKTQFPTGNAAGDGWGGFLVGVGP
jgi:hypothetical protein